MTRGKKKFSATTFVNLLIGIFLVATALFSYNYFRNNVEQHTNRLPSNINNPMPSIAQKIMPPTVGTYLGISLHDKQYDLVDTLEKSINKNFAIVGYYAAWGDVNNSFDLGFASTLKENNKIPLITWEPWVPISGYDRSESVVNEPAFLLKNINSGQYDKYITIYAKSIRNYGGEVMLRFAHEMNGNWYPWGSTFNTPNEYVSAWQHVHDIFEANGATNATWVWSPNEIYEDAHVPFASDILKFYPGDAYVDWVGFSSFNWAGLYKQNVSRSPEVMMSQTINVLQKLNKPIMIAETASAETGNPSLKANWIRDLAKYIKITPEIKAVIWFNSIDNGINWKIDSSILSKQAFSTVFSDSSFLSTKEKH